MPKRRVSKRWRDLLALIPGYDCFAHDDGCWFDEKTADMACEFFPAMCRHVKGELGGHPVRLELWQQAWIGCLFGWKREDGTRRYRECMVYVPRKNGKSTVLAGMVLMVMVTDEEPGAEIYSAAADRDQAALIYKMASGMVHREPELSSRMKSFDTYKSIQYGDVSYRALSSEANTKHGYNPHFVVVDELHAQKDAELVEVLHTGMGARRQPLMFYITTADYARESICNTKLEYARKVRDNDGDRGAPGYDPAFLPVIYEASVDDDWTDPEVWAQANPNLGISLSHEYMERECRRAKSEPSYENTFKRLHLNIQTEQAERWLPMDRWDACSDQPIYNGQPVYAGLDLSSTTDVTALVLAWEDGGHVCVVPHFWIPEDVAREKERSDRVPYLTWKRLGLVETTPGNVVDYSFVRRRINEIARDFRLQSIGFDDWNATQIAIDLAETDGLHVVNMRQGFRTLGSPSKELERLTVGGLLRHGGNKPLRWMASSVAIVNDDAGNIKPSKKHSTQKIDGIVALIMALGLLRSEAPPTASVYETRGIRTL